jgi:hypothetical protein
MKTKVKATSGNRVAHPFAQNGGLAADATSDPGNERMSRAMAHVGPVSDNGVRIALAEMIGEMGSQEVAVMTLLARRLLEGQRVYGRIDVANDPRDFEAERGAEIADVLVYSAFGELRRLLAAGEGL